MKLTFSLSCSLLFILSSALTAQNKVRWLTFEEALRRTETKPRKILVDVYTDWCVICKKMESTTLSEDKIAKYINEHYYPVRFNAEQKESINFNGQIFDYVKSYPKGYHELAFDLLGGKLSFPSMVIIDENLRIAQALEGFLNCSEMEMVLNYFATNNYKTISWRSFIKSYQQNVPVGNDR